MNALQKKKLLQKIVRLEHDIDQLKSVRISLASAEYASASMSSGGGSRSYTRADLSKISSTIQALETELKNTRKLLSEQSQITPKQIYTIYSC